MGESLSKGLNMQNEQSPEGFAQFPLTSIIGDSQSKTVNEQNEQSPERFAHFPLTTIIRVLIANM